VRIVDKNDKKKKDLALAINNNAKCLINVAVLKRNYPDKAPIFFKFNLPSLGDATKVPDTVGIAKLTLSDAFSIEAKNILVQYKSGPKIEQSVADGLLDPKDFELLPESDATQGLQKFVFEFIELKQDFDA